MIFNFSFSGGNSFKFQGDSGSSRHLEIVFPNGNILTINNNTIAQSYPSGGTGLLGQFSSSILATFFEITSTNDIIINTKQLREDIALYPEYFKTPEGDNAEFSYEYFPSGVYKVTYTITNTIPDPPPTLGGGNVTETKYIKMDQAANICLKRKIEWLFKNELEGDTTQYEYDLIQKQVMQLIMMMHIADFDFINLAYQETNLKLIACDNVCATGNLGYLYDATRP